jgi:hypothetical protein
MEIETKFCLALQDQIAESEVRCTINRLKLFICGFAINCSTVRWGHSVGTFYGSVSYVSNRKHITFVSNPTSVHECNQRHLLLIPRQMPLMCQYIHEKILHMLITEQIYENNAYKFSYIYHKKQSSVILALFQWYGLLCRLHLKQVQCI